MAKKRTRRERFLSEHGDRPGVQRHPHPAGPQRLRECSMQAPADQGCSAPQGGAALIGARGAVTATPGCIDHPGSQHIGNRTKDSTCQSPRFIVGNVVHQCLQSDSLSFVLFTLRSGHSGLGFYTTRRDAAPEGMTGWFPLLD
jgi:hypothetical protein